MQKYPYKNKQEECGYNKTTDMLFKIDAFKAYERMNNADLEKLVCQGAVSVSIRINNCIKNYKSGILHDEDGKCGCTFYGGGTNHAVAIVGFGEEPLNKSLSQNSTTISPCRKFWVVKNSWGTEWGENGFMRVCREDDKMTFGTCNIRSEPMIALLKNML